MARGPNHWLIAISSTIGLIIITLFILQLLLAFGVIEPYARNGLNFVHVTCDGEQGLIKTQRYNGFVDYEVTTLKSHPDLPITQHLRCEQASITFERRKDILDRIGSRVLCGSATIGTYLDGDLASIQCSDDIIIEVFRI